jgi:hypothetical protein
MYMYKCIMVMNLFMGIGIIKEYNINFKRVISFFLFIY